MALQGYKYTPWIPYSVQASRLSFPVQCPALLSVEHGKLRLKERARSWLRSVPLAQLAARAAVAARGSHRAEPPVKALSPEAPVKALSLSGSRSEEAGAGAPVRPTSSEPGLQALRVPELREACRRRGLRVSGRKAELVERLGAAKSPD